MTMFCRALKGIRKGCEANDFVWVAFEVISQNSTSIHPHQPAIWNVTLEEFS